VLLSSLFQCFFASFFSEMIFNHFLKPPTTFFGKGKSQELDYLFSLLFDKQLGRIFQPESIYQLTEGKSLICS